MKEYFCEKCNIKIKVNYKHTASGEIPYGTCPKCKTKFENLNDSINNHNVYYRDNIRHCFNCGKEFKVNYGPREHDCNGYGLQFHKCNRCEWIIGWQHTFSHGEYAVAMENEKLFNQRQYFWDQLKKYNITSVEGDEEFNEMS